MKAHSGIFDKRNEVAMVLSTEQRLHLAQEALEELLLVLSLPHELTREESVLWATLLRAIPIERSCLVCSNEFLIANPHEVLCPTCSDDHDLALVQEIQPQRKGVASHMIGVQSGLSLARRSLDQLRKQAPVIAQALEDTLTMEQTLLEIAGQQQVGVPSLSVAEMVNTLSRVVNAWIELADD
jgi:hypothetical protein